MSCEKTGESIFAPRAGEIRVICINFGVCPHCGAVYRGQEFVGIATDIIQKYGQHGLMRTYDVASPRPFHCGCRIDAISIHNDQDGIRVSDEFKQVVEVEHESLD